MYVILCLRVEFHLLFVRQFIYESLRESTHFDEFRIVKNLNTTFSPETFQVPFT